MTLSELEAAVGWMERHRLVEHLTLIEDDPHYRWSAQQSSEWKPPQGKRAQKAG